MNVALALIAALAVAAAPKAERPQKPAGELVPDPPSHLVPAAIEPSKPPFSWSIPRVVEDAPVEGGMQSLGVPVRAHAVRSEERMDVLYEHIVRSFRAAQLYVPPPPYQFHFGDAVSVTAIDDERMISYTAIFQPNPDGTTTLILGEADLAARNPAPEEGGVPAMPGARGVLRSLTEGAQTLTYSVGATREEVLGYYREVLPSFGFTESEPGAFVRGTARVTVMTTPEGKGRQSVVVLEQARGR